MGGIATSVFCLRNFNKVKGGEFGRAPVAVVQCANGVSQATQGIISKVDDLGRWAQVGENVSNAAAKVSGLASKITNPLLVGAAGIRVLTAENKEDALIQETCAMGGMFAGEKIYKILKNTVESGAGKTLKTGQKALQSGALKDCLTKLGGKISKLSSGKQKALFILGELGLVGVSIASFSLFKKLGKYLTGDDGTQKAESKADCVVQDKNQSTANNPWQNVQSTKNTQNPFAISDADLAAAQSGAKIY